MTLPKCHLNTGPGVCTYYDCTKFKQNSYKLKTRPYKNKKEKHENIKQKLNPSRLSAKQLLIYLLINFIHIL